MDNCIWVYDDFDFYETSCGHAFGFDEKGINENGFVFCPFCGSKINEENNELAKT